MLVEQNSNRLMVNVFLTSRNTNMDIYSVEDAGSQFKEETVLEEKRDWSHLLEGILRLLRCRIAGGRQDLEGAVDAMVAEEAEKARIDGIHLIIRRTHC